MTTVAKIDRKPANKTNLPKPPKDPQKKATPWAKKRLDNVMRALRALTVLEARFSAAKGEARPEFKVDANAAAENIGEAVASAEAALANIQQLVGRDYKPQSERVPLATGVPVWIRGAVWARKYHGLFTPEDMKGLKVIAVQGKLARAQSTSGKEIIEPVGSFRTYEVDYTKAVEERAA